MELELQKPELSEYPLKIHNFVYNGFYGHEREGTFLWFGYPSKS